MSIFKHIIEHEDILSKDNLLDIVHLMSSEVNDYLDENEKHHLMRKIWCIISDGHYNEKFAKEDVEKMYVETSSGNLYAPFYTLEQTNEVYDKLKKSNDILSIYNRYDFYVVMNMIASDNHNLYKKRFSNYGQDMITELYIEDSLNWLNDKDNPYGTSKIWKYLNSND